MLTFLHLSDLHFTTADAGTQFDRDSKIREALLLDLGPDGRCQFDAIFVTGDIAYHGYEAEFARAKAWLEEVRVKAGSAPEAIFVVPGNHDVNQETASRDSSLWDLHQGLRKEMPHEARLHRLNKKLRDPFDFLAALAEYRNFASAYECPTSALELAWVHVLDGEHLLDDGTGVRVHGLNTALISDGEDRKANLLLGAPQFHHFDAHPGYVNIVLCHHPHSWLIDGNQANDFFRTQAHLVLSGHEHETRCYVEGGSLRLFAGAIHPNPRESHWEPSYNVLRLTVQTAPTRELVVAVETRVWRDKDKVFGPAVQPDGGRFFEAPMPLPAWTTPARPESEALVGATPSGQVESLPVTAPLSPDAFLAARRKLLVHFFRLGTIARYKVVIDAGVWDDGDDAFDGQARWARVFDRATAEGKLGTLWQAVATEDESLADQPNPFLNQLNAP